MRPLFVTLPTLAYLPPAVSAKYRLPRQALDFVKAAQNNPSHNNRIPRNGQEDEDDGRRISGSDVLRALQGAAARKKKVKQKKQELSPAEGGTEDKVGDVDLSEVRELQIKSEWSTKLEELEQRLRDLDETI